MNVEEIDPRVIKDIRARNASASLSDVAYLLECIDALVIGLTDYGDNTLLGIVDGLRTEDPTTQVTIEQIARTITTTGEATKAFMSERQLAWLTTSGYEGDVFNA